MGADVTRLEEKIIALIEQQIESLRAGTIVGMTSEEFKDYDERRFKIASWLEQLAQSNVEDLGLWKSGRTWTHRLH